MNTWLTSDPHFRHRNIIGYSRSEFFSDLEEMEAALIENHNSVVAPNDTVYMLGDVVMGKRAEALPLLDLLNGNKILILGNHDYPHASNPAKVRNRWTSEYAQYFSGMFHHVEMWELNALLVHFPAFGDHTEEERYTEFRPVEAFNRGQTIIHGHLHCEDIVVHERHVHVGIDADWTAYGVERYHPIPLEAVREVLS